MKIAILQPYIFPYLGYFQLINAVETFVFFDDVNFIKKGWINRNQLLENNQAKLFSIPLIGASQNKLINNTYLNEYDKWRSGFYKKIELSYKNAPNFESINILIHETLDKDYDTISQLAISSILGICNYLDLNKDFRVSSDIAYDKSGRGQHKILDISQRLQASVYINPINGQYLYEKSDFSDKNIDLTFINMNEIKYKQFKDIDFVDSLSIIDVLMFNRKEKLKLLLNEYTLI